MFSTPSYGEWTKVGKSVDGDTFYVDFERIRKHGGYVYWWDLNNYLKPISKGYFSTKTYFQGDCKLFRYKPLSGTFYKESMGGGTGDLIEIPTIHKGWRYPMPDSADETILKRVCNQ